MTKTSISLQDLRRKIYLKAKADKAWRFWGLYIHVCKMETLQTAYNEAKNNNGAPGIDGVTFEDIEKAGVEVFLKQIRDELVSETYRPMRNRNKEIPKGKDKVRILGIPILRGWVNYFRVGNSSECFGYIKDWVEKKIRVHLMRARKRRGFGWNRWSKAWFYKTLGLFNDYRVRHYNA